MNYVYEHKILGDIDVSVTVSKKSNGLEEVKAFAIFFINLEEYHCVVTFDKDESKELNRGAITRRLNKAIRDKLNSLCVGYNSINERK